MPASCLPSFLPSFLLSKAAAAAADEGKEKLLWIHISAVVSQRETEEGGTWKSGKMVLGFYFSSVWRKNVTHPVIIG
jgi:hypothetical protein